MFMQTSQIAVGKGCKGLSIEPVRVSGIEKRRVTRISKSFQGVDTLARISGFWTKLAAINPRVCLSLFFSLYLLKRLTILTTLTTSCFSCRFFGGQSLSLPCHL